MIGTFINVATVIVGGLLGSVLGDRLSEKIQSTVMTGLGLFTMLLGVVNFLDTQNVLIVLASILIGAILGEWMRIEEGLRRLGQYLQQRWAKHDLVEMGESRFIQGFVTASLLFCVGPMTILGSVQDGLTGDYTTLLIKAIMDGFAAMAFASTFGVGVLFSAVVVLVYQGALTLLASQVEVFVSEAMMMEMSAVGGLLLVGIAMNSLLEIKKIRIGSFLPALFLAPIIVWGLTALNIHF